jgi:predicted CXXCH cytochrome family protein
MAFTTCATAGCHNYHDNSALYEDFLVTHAGRPALADRPRVPARDLRLAIAARGDAPVPQLPRLAGDGPRDVGDPVHVAAWEAAVHARAGVNCSGCHAPAGGAANGSWVERPSQAVCASCHEPEVTGMRAGRHGMRLAHDLPPMVVAAARMPMTAGAAKRELTCSSCHPAHAFDTREAAMESCLGCHDDRHSRAYLRSPHYALLLQERAGELDAGRGVSCATCHLPRRREQVDGRTIVTVQHNQNDNLRPNEKMIRSVCLDCHGLGFSIDALADPGLIASNFKGTPVRSVAGIAMATSRLTKKPN